MPLLKCKVNRYIGRGLDLVEDEVAEVDEKLAEELLADFPEWFEVVNPEKEAKQEQTKEVKSRVTK